MGLFDLFKKWPDPQPQYDDEILGPMTWSDDDESWMGESRGVKYQIAYDCEATPTSESLAYAREMLADLGVFDRSLEQARAAAALESPDMADEIAGLRIDVVRFCVRNRKRFRMITVDLAGGRQERSWFMEFKDKECAGISF
jgi:hypothetical protein